ncbi:MAG: nitroreductase [Streptosporangiales bacterium]|nr:nitroreductase [Streptosporangiales bacterium]
MRPLRDLGPLSSAPRSLPARPGPRGPTIGDLRPWPGVATTIHPVTRREAGAVSDRQLTEGDLDDLIAAAVRAPSLHNTQPWRFVARPEAIEVHADPSRALRVIDPDARELTLSCGATVFNLRVAAARAKREPHVQLLPDPEVPTHLATVWLDRPVLAGAGYAGMYDALWRRRMNRRPFRDAEVPEPRLAELVEAAKAEGAALRFLRRHELAELLAVAREADRRQRCDSAYRAELAAWTTDDPWRTDGIHSSTLGPYPQVNFLPVRDFGLTRLDSARRIERFESDPKVAVLATAGDDRPDWLRAGQALQRVLVVTAMRGLAASLFSQPLELTDLRRAVRDLGGIGAPQMILRVGHGRAVLPSARRPVRDVKDLVPRVAPGAQRWRR